jgi:hypothetical protein
MFENNHPPRARKAFMPNCTPICAYYMFIMEEIVFVSELAREDGFFRLAEDDNKT